MSKKNAGVLLMLLCASMWSTGGILMKFVPWNAMVLSGMRSLIAGITIAVFMAIKHVPFTMDRRIFASGAALCCTYTFFVIANKLTTAANAIVLQYTAPVFIVVIGLCFMHVTFSRLDIAAVSLSLVGISLFFFDQLTPGGIIGNISGIAAGISMAIMYIINGGIEADRRLNAILTAQALCFLIGIPFLFVGEPIELTGTSVSCILLLGVVQLGIPYILYAKAAESCPPLACCLLGAVEPILNPVWVFLIDGEHPGMMALIGGAVVIATITIWSILGGTSQGKGASPC